MMKVNSCESCPGGSHGNRTGQLTLISTGRSSNRVLRLATGGHEEKRERMTGKRLTLGELGEFDGGAADVLCNGGGHARELGL